MLRVNRSSKKRKKQRWCWLLTVRASSRLDPPSAASTAAMHLDKQELKVGIDKQNPYSATMDKMAAIELAVCFGNYRAVDNSDCGACSMTRHV